MKKKGGEKQGTGECSAQSQAGKNGKRNTGSGAVSLRDLLEIFQQATIDLSTAGVSSRVVNHPDGKGCVLLLDGVRYCQQCHNLRLISDMVGDKSELCATCSPF